MLDFRHGGVVHTAGLLLAVAADKRNGVAVGKHEGAILNLPGLQTEVGSYLLNIEFFHFPNLRKRSLMTPQKASPKMPPDIFEVPSLRLMKITGTSAILKPSLWAVYFISI